MRPVRRLSSLKGAAAALVAAATFGLSSGGSAAGTDLFVGVADDGLKWRPSAAVAIARALGMKAFRITLDWQPWQARVSSADAELLDAAIPAAYGMRVVVAVYGRAVDAPLDAAARSRYCAYVDDLLERYPTINDVVVWNEPNLSYFWQPQFNPDGTSAAPAAYGALLARCWDVLHARRPTVNVVTSTSPRGNDRPRAASNVSHAPATFIRRLGDAYRASGRSRPIFDVVGHHAYGHSAERPWRRHPGSSHIAQGDWDALVAALDQAFRGTAQPLPGQPLPGGRRVAIWYLEAGYQTRPDAAKASLYTSVENDPHAVPDEAGGERPSSVRPATSRAPDQATQIRDGVRLAYCQPHVEAYFNFLLWDEPDLRRWQSGVLWVDGSRKDSFSAFQQAIGEVNAGRVDCASVARSQAGGTLRP